MSETDNLYSDGPGRFATARKGGICGDVDFILAQKAKGTPTQAIAQMVGRSTVDVRQVISAATIAATERPAEPVKAPEPKPLPDPKRDWRVWSKRSRRMPAGAKAIVQAVGDRRGVSMDELIGEGRSRRVAHVRQEAYDALYRTGRYTLPMIGAYFGGRDHTSVLYGIREHKKRIEADLSAWLALGEAA